jgi:hypothetical protein
MRTHMPPLPLPFMSTSRYARTHDIAFLHTVSKVVAAIHADESLRRVDPPTVAAALADTDKRSDL